jgi:endonuclease/exonuclease/phosphatase family metal-dependent hydrolase
MKVNYIRLAGILLVVTLGNSVDAEQEATIWRPTTAFPAAEANQAAATDERHSYAITNSRIGKYDRATGDRLAVSTGEAKHLNSGYLWEGKLYCAHSNYPLVPERSEIKVLDPESMRLTTFKDFGNFGGSLTWAVRHEGHWWCNFARYGADNGQTFLVRFDNDWRETGRWRYPTEVIRRLGRMSISGGLWHNGSLLVTGHDDPVLFRLRLPADSHEVLTFVEKQLVPFTGQGIAADPLTGGLVGIHRARRQVIFAIVAEPTVNRIRVLTYNIHHGEGTDGKLDLDRIARVIKAAEPDIVALQEVDQKIERSGRIDQPAELARLTGMSVAFGANFKFQGGDYGNAVLTRLPIMRSKNHLLPRHNDGEQRGVLECELKLPSGDKVLLLTTHLDHRRDEAERLASAKAINELVAAHKEAPAFVAGDLNAVPESSVLKQFLTAWSETAPQPLPTIPVEKPERQIDYVLVRPAGRWKVIEAKVLDESVASDHRPLLVVLELLPPAK